GETEVFGGSRPRGARGSIQPGRASPAGRCGLGLRGRTGLDELVQVLTHGVLMQTGHGRQGRDRHGARLGGEVLVHEGDRRGQARLRDRRFGPEHRRILICMAVCVTAIVFHGSIVINSARPSAPGPWSMSQAPPAGDPIHPTGDAARARPTGDGGPGHVAGRNGEENLYQSPTPRKVTVRPHSRARPPTAWTCSRHCKSHSVTTSVGFSMTLISYPQLGEITGFSIRLQIG